MKKTLIASGCLLVLGCATTGADVADREAGIGMNTVEQTVGGEVAVAEADRDLPPIDLVEHGATQVAAFGLG